MRQAERNAFTLIELLVVMAILSILMAVLVPSLRRARELALLATCASNIRNTWLGLQMYGADGDGSYPLSDEGGDWPDVPADYMGSSWGWSGPPGLLFAGGYLDDPKIAHCPGRGGLTEHGWPKSPFGPNDYYLAYEYCQLRRCDLWVGRPWRSGLRYSNSYWGGMLLRCVSSVHEVDPRGWTHQQWVNEFRNDGTWRQRDVPVVGLIVYSTWNIQVLFEPGYVTHDDWWLAE